VRNVLAGEAPARADDPESAADAWAGPGHITDAYALYYPRLVRFVRHRANTYGLSEARVDVEGVVQETFTLAFSRWSTIENPPAWLFTVAGRLVSRARRLDVVPAGDVKVADEARWSSLAPRADLDDVHAAREVVAAIAALPGKQRAATYLRHVAGWSAPEIAELLACAPATVHTHVHRGTAAVRAARRESDLDRPVSARDVGVLAAALVGIGVLVAVVLGRCGVLPAGPPPGEALTGVTRTAPPAPLPGGVPLQSPGPRSSAAPAPVTARPVPVPARPAPTGHGATGSRIGLWALRIAGGLAVSGGIWLWWRGRPRRRRRPPGAEARTGC
jgi:RNA polymerase sigma factor (sigma-70 family)